MQVNYQSTISDNTIIDENGSLNQFYSLANQLSKTRYVRFTGKSDDADNIDWHFRYKGRPLVLQYSIYNGLSIYSLDSKGAEKVQQLVEKLKPKSV